MQNIKAIIFDLGGVLLNIDFKKVSDAFKALGVENFDELYSQSKANPLFKDLEIGKISEADFCNHVKKYSSETITNNDIIKAWNAILLDFRKESLEYLKKLKGKYKLFLLSNTNIIHFKAFNKIYIDDVGQESFNALFEVAYYSHQIGYRKPDATAYLHVIKENNLQPGEILFIDDTFKNIEAAKSMGMATVFLEQEMKIENLNLLP